MEPEFVRRHAVLAFPAVLAAVVLVLLTGCTAKHYKESADKEVYGILKYKRGASIGETRPFTIEPNAQDPLDSRTPTDATTNTNTAAVKLSLRDALELAAKHSREYQTQKEQVYLSALALTLQRHQFAPIFGLGLSGRRTRSGSEEYNEGSSAFSIKKALGIGGTIGLTITNDLLRYVTGKPRNEASTLLALDLTQPLWRGAGKRIAQENLTQAERDTVYAIRSFARYQKTFCVTIATSFYRLLQQLDSVRNARQNYDSLVAARKRAEWLGNAGRLPEFQVDQARQDELSARNRWIRARESYKQQVDALRIELGLETDAPVEFDYAEIERLRRRGLVTVRLKSGEAIRIAFQRRLDFQNQLNAVEDAKRKVEVARNGLGPDVTLVGSASVGSRPDTKPASLRFHQGTYSGGIDLDLPLDRKSERNTYRTALISVVQAHRDLSLARDQIKLALRQALRTLAEARESYEIQGRSLALAERRVESTALLLQAGRATTRDLLEAQEALIQAQNRITAALIDHTLARLQLHRDMGTLRVDERGMWQETAYEGKTDQKNPS